MTHGCHYTIAKGATKHAGWRDLLMQVITCAASDSQDIVLKKSLNQYITTYCNANPELMLLTINMLLKDCQDQDPTIRGLALRSLCSLTIANLTEYLVLHSTSSSVCSTSS